MKIKRVVIKNYRSIKHVAFEPGNLCTLIGENNSGKSTILRAINLVLGEQWPSERSFDETDFHKENTADPITIEVYFDTPIQDTRGTKPNVSGFRLTCKAYQRASGDRVAGELRTEFTCIGPQGGAISAQPYRQGSPPTPSLAVTNALRNQVPMLYVDVLREYARHGPSSRWSVLRKLIDQIGASFASDKSQVTVVTDQGPAKMTRRAAYDFYTAKAQNVLRTAGLLDLERKLADNALEQMGLQPGTGGVSLGFSGYDPINAFRNLELIVDQFGIRSRAQEVGAGLQSSVVVAIFRTYEQLRRTGAIFAIEEPEAFLHPQRARYFASILEQISTADNQVLIATHSPYFVKLHLPETIGLVRRTASAGTGVTRVSSTTLTPDLVSGLKIQTQVHAERGEMLFARKVLLVEGQTERIAMPFILDIMGIDANREGVSIVDCGSKDSIPFFVGIARAFGIPNVVIADLDPGKPQTATERLKAVCRQEDLFLLDPDFEGVSGYSAGDKIVEAYKHFSNISQAQLAPGIVDAVQRLLAL